MILPAQAIRRIIPPVVLPFVERSEWGTMTYGLSVASYDIRIAQTTTIYANGFALASAMEKFFMPLDVMGVVCDKSSWARQGIAMQNTVIDPGFIGFLTLEISNHTDRNVVIEKGCPIAQIVFHRLEEPAERGYSGKYQFQEAGPQKARLA